VFSWIAQTIAVTSLGIRNIPQRLGSSLVAIVGIAGVVIVFVAVLSIGEGFKAAMTVAGSPSRALVMRSGADSEMTSGMSGRSNSIRHPPCTPGTTNPPGSGRPAPDGNGA